MRLFRALPQLSRRGTGQHLSLPHHRKRRTRTSGKRRNARRSHPRLALSSSMGTTKTRAGRGRIELSIPVPMRSNRWSSPEFQQLVETHLMRLSQVEKTVLVLYHQEERSYDQIAEALQIPIGTVRTHLHRGRKKLKDAIAKDKGGAR